MTQVNKDNYPHVFKAFSLIDLYNGAVNRYEPARDVYEVPDKYSQYLVASETGLASMSPEKLEEFCMGEEPPREVLSKEPYLTANLLLNAYFQEWIEE